PTGSEVSAGPEVPEVPAVSAEPFRSVYQMRLHAEFAEQFVQRSQRQALPSLPHNRRIIAAAGIGHPQRFFDMLSSYGVVLADTIALPDHYDYRSNPFRHVRADMILITEKDAVKCGGTHELASDARLWVVPVVVAIDQPLLDNIVEKLRGPSTA
ncbi:MAG: tetraacyldisaccharide 4'-kinase, partial [Betaproteobacteria bacterium]